MISIDTSLTPASLLPDIERMWKVSARTLDSLEASWTPEQGAPVFTVKGKYTSRGWTEWTQGFQFGSLLLQFDGTGDEKYLELGRRRTFDLMAPHISHIGVHDHGFNNVSTYGALRRLFLEGRIRRNDDQLAHCDLALKISGAVQAARWSETSDGDGYIYSFNGPHSLFCDTIRSLRSLSVGHLLGHSLMGENDESISLLDRVMQHARSTARYNVFFGEGRDHYDVRGRVAHESIFNTNDGRYRCPSSQQGYCPFTTWTRGAAWIIAGYPEQIEFAQALPEKAFEKLGGREDYLKMLLATARATADYYLTETPTDGVPYWDTGAPGLVHLGDYRDRPADPFNEHEPVDSSAAAITVQGLIRLGRILEKTDPDAAKRYSQAGLTALRSLLRSPYLNDNPEHQGLLWHSVYHRPRGWDYIPPNAKTPRGEACQWGDYHLREAALLVQRMAKNAPYYTFFGPV